MKTKIKSHFDLGTGRIWLTIGNVSIELSLEETERVISALQDAKNTRHAVARANFQPLNA